MLSTFLWWLAIEMCSLAALPLTWRLFARLPGRGYAFAKAAGVLLASYVLWLGASLRLLPNDLGGAAVALAVLVGLSLRLGRHGLRRAPEGTRPILVWLRENKWLVVACELLFATVLAAWAFFKAHNPEIAHTEKPMEFAFLNGVLRSRFFPPQDPWLSGYAISYYYFGYVMLGLLVRLTGVAPQVGFNLGVAGWYGLVALGAFGLTHALVAIASARGSAASGAGRAIRWGLLGAMFVGLLGNLEGLVDTAYHRGLLPSSVIQWFDIKGLSEGAPTGGWTGDGWWWWRATRVIHDKDLLGNSVEVISEFPLFSFLLGDMHPHVLAFPFVFLAAALALSLLLAGDRWSHEKAASPAGVVQRLLALARGALRFLGEATGLGGPGIVLYALFLGGLAFLNTWDFPIYVGLSALALAAGQALRHGLTRRAVWSAILAGGVFALAGVVSYLPFYVGFQSQLGGVLPNLLFPSRLRQFFLMFGPFLVIAACFLVLVGIAVGGRRVARGLLAALPWTLVLPILTMVVVALGVAALPQGRAFVQQVLANPAVRANVSDPTLGGLAALAARVRLAAPWTFVVLAALIAWTAGTLWTLIAARRQEARGEESGGGALAPAAASDAFAVLLIGLALILTLAPEFIYLRDLFGTRMNTVFKFYYQAWAMLAVASAYGLSRLAERGTPLVLKVPALVLAGFLVLGGLWYPVAAIPYKADGFRTAATLDGLAYLRQADPAEMAAIEWLRSSAAPDAVVVEAPGGSYEEVGSMPANRVSMITGNPTLLGWDFHERQWRGGAYEALAGGRAGALDQIYRAARAEQLPALLEDWGVDYVFVGSIERREYGMGDALLARLDGALQLVYDRDGVRIYAR